MKHIKQIFFGLLFLFLLLFSFRFLLLTVLKPLFLDVNSGIITETYRIFTRYYYALIALVGLYFIYRFQRISSPLKPFLVRFLIVSVLLTFLTETAIELISYLISPTYSFFELSPNADFYLVFPLIGKLFVFALIEELVFRHFLITHLQGVFKKRRILIILISAFLFSLAHIVYQDVSIILSIFIFGFLYSSLFLKYKSIWVPVGVHIGHNLFSYLLGGDIIELTSADNFIYGVWWRPLITLFEASIIYYGLTKLCPIKD